MKKHIATNINDFFNENKITEGTQVTYAEDLAEIPSEYIEPYAKRFLMMQMQSIYLGFETPKDVRATLEAVEYFITTFSGIHAQHAVSNEYSRFTKLSDAQMKEICIKVFGDKDTE